MLNLFKSKEKEIKVTDIVWMSKEAKWNGIAEKWRSDNSLVIICWFQSTKRQLENLPGWDTGQGKLYVAEGTWSSYITGKKIIFAEHYPLLQKEQEFFRQHSFPEVIVYSSLDEPLFKQFGSERIINLMKQLGMKDDESFQHSMISSSIRNAQEKIGRKVETDLISSSPEEWFQKNFISQS